MESPTDVYFILKIIVTRHQNLPNLQSVASHVFNPLTLTRMPSTPRPFPLFL